MHHKEKIFSRYFNESDNGSEDAQFFVDSFRARPETSTPKEWMTYIDILMGLYKGHEIETPADDLVVLEMVPMIQDTSFIGLNVARRYLQDYKNGNIMAYLKIVRSDHEPIRAAILAGRNPSNDPIVKKVVRRDDKRYLCPSIKYPDIFNAEIDTALKQSCLPIELLNANA